MNFKNGSHHFLILNLNNLIFSIKAINFNCSEFLNSTEYYYMFWMQSQIQKVCFNFNVLLVTRKIFHHNLSILWSSK